MTVVTSPIIPNATPTLPTLRVAINRNDITKDLQYEESNFTVTPYAETQVPVRASSSFVQIPMAFVTPINKIIAIAPSDTNPDIPAYSTLRLKIEDGTNLPFFLDLPFQNLFMWCPPTYYAEYITEIYVSTASVSLINVQVRIYG